MRKRSLSLVLFAGVSCGGATAKAPPAAAPPPAAPAAAATPPAAPAAPARVEPDVPAGADAARDAELARTATGILEAFANHAADLAPDGKQVAYASTRDGLNQVYLGDPAHPDAPPVRLVSATERAVEPVFTLDGKAVLFVSDKGADENFSIFRASLTDAHSIVELTPGEKLRRSPPLVPDRAGGAMFFTANRADEREVHLYRAGTDAPGAPKLLYTDAGPGGMADVSRDGRQALVTRYVSISDILLFVVDLESGKARQLYPAEGAHVTINAAGFSADGRRVLVATDEGGEKGSLLALDAASGKEVARYVETKPATANLAALAVSPAGDRVAVLVDAGNRNEVRVLDARTLKLEGTPALPLGAGGLGRFGRDGRRFTVTWSSPDAPPDIFAIDAASRKVTPLRADARPTLANLGKIDASITQVPSNGLAVPVNVYLPHLGRGVMRKKLPVIVVVHGGPASASTVDWNPWALFFTGQGYAVVEPNVRGSTGFGRAYERADNGDKRLAAVGDLGEVGRWASAQPWADGRVIVFGGSYGGYMTLMGLTHQPELWKAGVDLAGPANLVTFMATTTAEIRSVFTDEFGDPDKDRAFLESISPLHDIDRIVAPLFVYQGANDPRVPEAEAGQIVAALRARKIPVEYMLVANEGHSLEHRENHAMFLARSARFLEKVLGAAAAAPTR